MKCPYCDKEMIPGYLQGPRGVFWTDKAKNFFFFPRETKGDIVIAGTWGRSSGDNAYLCRSCGKIIIDVKYNTI
jgi:hypothetical protein